MALRQPIGQTKKKSFKAETSPSAIFPLSEKEQNIQLTEQVNNFREYIADLRVCFFSIIPL